jgi:release factor glutamine methyltransferase
MSAPKADRSATLAAVLGEARLRLAAGDIEDPALEARIIVEHFAATERRDAIVSPGRRVTPDQLAAIDAALARRLAGEPVHRIFGWRDFYGLRLRLSPDTLEPRPDTETLVDAVLPFLRGVAGREGFCRVLDLGTGTGAIALALAAQVTQATVTATDISPGALATAAENAAAAGLSDRFIPLLSDWFLAVRGKFHAIVSNPPYICRQEIDRLQPEVRLHDPRRALDGGPDGLDAYRTIAAGAAAHLEDGGMVAVEIGDGQRQEVDRLFAEAGYRSLSSYRDLAGTERALVFCR